MKKTLLAFTAVFMLLISAHGQGPHNVIIFSETGELFTLFINGAQQNDAPTAHIKVEDLRGTGYQLRVLFETAMPGEFSKHMPLPEGSSEITYALRKNNRGNWVARYISDAPYPAVTVERDVDVRREVSPPSPPVSESRSVTPGNQRHEVITTTTIVDDDMDTDPSGVIDIRINAGEDNFGMNISIDDRSQRQSTTISSQTMVTEVQQDYEVVEHHQPAPAPVKSDGCDYPMSDTEFDRAKESISSKSFEDSKMSIARQITRGNCLTALQVKGIMQLFSFEDSRLEFAKFAYKYTYDKRNYYLVNDAFQFEMTIDELDEFLNQ
jgi:hypothetical protein